ncbi:MAG: molybdate ABC transporter substrate-binding protein [Anaerolineae bacterium]
MFRPLMRAFAGVLALLLLTACAGEAAAEEETTLTVSAAADLIPAFRELGDLFSAQTGVPVAFNFGSSGQITQQVEQGAPVDVIAAANQAYIDELQAQGLVIPDTVALYAVGRITLWTRANSGLAIDDLQDLTADHITRVAIANPEHAPYGIAAREALQSAGIWEAIQPKLVFGENVSQTLQYAETGSVDVAIVALSLSIAAGETGRWNLIPQEAHAPIYQAMAVVAGTPHEGEARLFVDFVNSPEGRAVMRRYGFVLPGEEPFG